MASLIKLLLMLYSRCTAEAMEKPNSIEFYLQPFTSSDSYLVKSQILQLFLTFECFLMYCSDKQMSLSVFETATNHLTT